MDTSALEARIAGQAEESKALKAELQRLAAREAPDATLAGRIDGLEQAIASAAPADTAEMTARLAELEGRLAAIEAMPTDGSGASPAALAALQAEVAAMKGTGAALGQDLTKLAADAEARLAEAEAQAAAMKAEAEEIARKATAAAALGRLQAALESGGPFAAALTDLGTVEVPAVLRDGAETGLPTLASLTASFPDAARAALDAALRANMGESWSERVGTFLRNQTGARSLTPREGTDPDAVLSRAEAALVAGDLAGGGGRGAGAAGGGPRRDGGLAGAGRPTAGGRGCGDGACGNGWAIGGGDDLVTDQGSALCRGDCCADLRGGGVAGYRGRRSGGGGGV